MKNSKMKHSFKHIKASVIKTKALHMTAYRPSFRFSFRRP